jgi:hypothetical protein
MRSIVIAVLLLFFLCEAIPGTKKEFWEEKDYKQWSAQECSKILNNSPWTRKFTETWNTDENGIEDSRAYEKALGLPPRDIADYPSLVNRTSQPVTKTIGVQVQFHSALPVRQALVRQDQILAGYDSLSPEQRMAFDQKAETLLSPSNYNDKIVITIMRTSVHTNTKAVFLCGSKGKKVQLIKFTPADPRTGTFQYIFPRQVEGRPLIDAQDKELILEFPVISPYIKKFYFKFNVKKMMINGELQY